MQDFFPFPQCLSFFTDYLHCLMIYKVLKQTLREREEKADKHFFFNSRNIFIWHHQR